MKYYLSIIPNQSTNYSIRKVVGDVGRVFHDQELDVRYTNPEMYSINMIYLGENLNIFQKLMLKYKLSKFRFNNFYLSFGNVKVGKKREYKGLVYLTIDNGGDNLRDMYFKLCKVLGNQYNSFFIPHISLGRINNDLSAEEFSNIDVALTSFNNEYKYNRDEISVSKLLLIASDNTKLEIIKEYQLF